MGNSMDDCTKPQYSHIRPATVVGNVRVLKVTAVGV